MECFIVEANIVLPKQINTYTMELITMESRVLKTIIHKLNSLEKNFAIAVNERAQLENKYVNMVEASHMLQVSERTIYKLIKKGALKCTKYNRKLRFKVSEIERFLEESNQ